MAAPAALRARFLDDGTSGAAPHVLVVRLYERLLLDMERGADALRAGDRQASHNALVNAQGIVNGLLVALDGSDWEGAERLRGVYAFLLTELAQANVRRDADRVDACRRVVQPLRDAWTAASTSLAQAPRTAPSAQVIA